jgi:hypothetical protein
LSAPLSLAAEEYFEFDYDNDLFTQSDRNYTQGVGLVWGNSRYGDFPLMAILPGAGEGSSDSYELDLHHRSYTPDAYELEAIQFGDRPFAATLSLITRKISRNEESRLTLTSELELGLIGPLAGGDFIQSSIHTLTGSDEPGGWGNQIENDLVANYGLYASKGLFHNSRFELLGIGAAELGSLRTNLGVGAEFRFGLNGDLIQRSHASEITNRRIAVSLKSQIHYVLYDATLQGGVFNDSSVYAIDSRDVENIVLRSEVSLTVKQARFQYSFGFSHISEEFAGGGSHSYGGFRLVFGRKF